MKRDSLLLLLFLVSLIFSGCETQRQQITATLTDYSDCKGLKSATSDDIPNTQSCINWSYDSSTGILSLTHINAGFNCCPGKLSCSIRITGDTLTIKEKEESAMCDCSCLYDLYINVNDLEEQGYIISIEEPYCGDQQKLIFEAYLASEHEDSFCADRSQYPWAIP